MEESFAWEVLWMSQEIPRQWLSVRCLYSRLGRPPADDIFQSTSSQILMPFVKSSPPPYPIRVSLTNVSFWFPSTSPRLMDCHFRYTKLKLTRSSKIRAFPRFLRISRRWCTSLALSSKEREKLCFLLARMRWNYTIP